VKEVLRVDEQRRIEVSRDTFQSLDIKIRKGQTIHVWALIGGSGQLQLLPPNSKLSKQRDRFGERRYPVDWDAAGDARTSTYRQLQSFMSVTCHARTQGTKVRITFPAEAVRVGLFRVPGTLVVATNGQIFEVWSNEKWEQSAKVSDLRGFTAAAEQALQ
jgi:hypothetical protein